MALSKCNSAVMKSPSCTGMHSGISLIARKAGINEMPTQSVSISAVSCYFPALAALIASMSIGVTLNRSPQMA